MRPRLRVVVLAALACSCAAGPGDEVGDDLERNDDSGADAGQREPDYRGIVSRVAVAPIDEEGTVVLALRGLSASRELHATVSTRHYDDTFVVLSASSAITFAGATHPWETTSRQSPDVDGDLEGDVGMIMPGHYRARARPASRNIAGAPTYAVGTLAGSGFVPGWRDTDHDGVFSAEEMSASEQRGDRLSAILFHQGGAGAPAAIGCQVMEASEYERFIAAVGGAGASFDVIVVDAVDVVDLLDLP